MKINVEYTHSCIKVVQLFHYESFGADIVEYYIVLYYISKIAIYNLHRKSFLEFLDRRIDV